MPVLAFTRQNKRTVAIEVMNDEGEPQLQITLDRFKPKDVQFLAEMQGVQLSEALTTLNGICEDEEEGNVYTAEFEPQEGLESLISRLTGTQTTVEHSAPSVPPETNETKRKFVIHVRDVTQLKQHGTAVSNDLPEVAFREALTVALQNPNLKEPLIEWTDLNSFCCLDIDYHELDDGLDADSVDKIVSRIRPQPLAYHYSHGGGVKLYYTASPGFSAKELASIAGISWINIDGRATFDLIGSTRHPCYGRTRDNKPAPASSIDSIAFLYGQADLSTVRKILCQDVEYQDIASFLAEQGLSFGEVLPHSKCPIQPTDDFKENVFVGEKGIFCHRCAAKGYGSGTQPGFVSYASLIGSNDSRVSVMVKNFCHYQHASIILENIYPNIPKKVLADVYRTMLKIVHTSEDPRIPLTMKAGEGYVRTRGMWINSEGTEPLEHGLQQFVNSLPAVKYVQKPKEGEEGGKLVSDVTKVIAFSNKGDLDRYGYYDVSFIRGCKIYGQFLKYKDGENICVVTRKEFKNHVPQYIPIRKRMPTEEAWGFLENEFNGIDRNYVKLLIAAKGASEGRLAQCPFLLICGVSGAGKSTTVHIAAGICGDKADEPVFTPNPERFRMGLMDAARNSGYVCINEIFKAARDARLNSVAALNPMLTLTEDSRSHVMYVGSVPFGRLPVFVLTDITIPDDVERDVQLARRFVTYRLPTQNNWQDNLVNKGIRPHEFRLLSYDHNAAADSILSEVIDEFFLEPTPLYKIAKELQSGTIDTVSSERDLTIDQLKKFYDEVLKAPELSGTLHTNRYKPHMGWRLIDRASDTQLNQLWGDLCDGREPDQWIRSRTIDSQDWKKIVSINDMNILCEVKYHKSFNYVYVRFRSADSAREPKWINGVFQK